MVTKYGFYKIKLEINQIRLGALNMIIKFRFKK